MHVCLCERVHAHTMMHGNGKETQACFMFTNHLKNMLFSDSLPTNFSSSLPSLRLSFIPRPVSLPLVFYCLETQETRRVNYFRQCSFCELGQNIFLLLYWTSCSIFKSYCTSLGLVLCLSFSVREIF